MSLPDLAWQMVYGRLAWAIVLLAVLASCLPAAWRPGRAPMAGAALGMAALMALPGQLSPAYALGLALQYPSGLLLGCALMALLARWRGLPGRMALPVTLAAPLAIGGAALYLDAFGLLAQGYYYAGFGPFGAPLLALLGICLCGAAIARGQGAREAVPLLGALLLFTLLRLPTGNLWDAVLDPLLWFWAVATLVRHLVRHARRRADVPAPAPGLAPDPARHSARAANTTEHLLISKEPVSDK